MKQLIIEQPITDFYNVDAIKELDKRIRTCDWVAAYETESGYIARLCSYKPVGSAWVTGFKYINPPQASYMQEMYFQDYNYIDSIKQAIKQKRKVLLFNSEAEFINWVINRLPECPQLNW